MRNLKRALSLALASVMVMGMMVVGTSASYKDIDDADNVEAIEVLQAVSIMAGDENGNFNPDAKVTRNEMAVIMSNLLNLDYDYYRGVNKFSDVPEWAAPYVAACAAEGVTAGIGNGLYGGSNTVTAAQAALMIMKTLGYFQYPNDFGDDWTVATIRQASYINLFDRINANAETPLTRNQVAQMVLNGLKANMVDFTGDVGLTVNGVSFGYRAEYTARTNAAAKYNRIDVGTTNIAANDQYYVQLGEELYNGDLVLRNAIDVFGRPSRYWEYDGEEIGTYVKKELIRETYTQKVTGRVLYDLLGTIIKDYSLEVYVDGEDTSSVLGSVYFDEKDIVRSNTDKVGGTGDGVLTEVFVDTGAKKITIAVINTYLAKADEDYDTKNEDVDLTIYEVDNKGNAKAPVYVKTSDTKVGYNVDLDDFDVSEVEEDDLFLVTLADGEIQSLVAPEILADVTVSNFKLGSYVTVDGTKYNYANTVMYDEEVLDAYDDANMKDTTYNVILDKYGYMIGIERNEDPDQYLFLTGMDGNNSNLSKKNADANVIFTDGTMKTITVKLDKSTFSDATLAKNFSQLNTWCKYTTDKDGSYTLTEIAVATTSNPTSSAVKVAQYAQDVGTHHDSGVATKTISKKYVSLLGAYNSVGPVANYVYGNDDTIYLNVELTKIVSKDASNGGAYRWIVDDVESVTTGVKNANLIVENLTNKDGYRAPTAEIYTLYKNNGYIIAAVTIGEDDGATSNYAYVTSSQPNREAYDEVADEWTWTREVVVNGEIVELTEKGDSLTYLSAAKMLQGEWYEIKYDADGNVRKATAIDFSVVGDKFETLVANVESVVRNNDTVVLSDTTSVNALTYKNGTLYTTTSQTRGFSVSPDVKVVLALANKAGTKEFDDVDDNYTSYSGLEKALRDLNATAAGFTIGSVEVNAILENGVATSIIINDKNGETGSVVVTPGTTSSMGVEVDTRALTVDAKFLHGTTAIAQRRAITNALNEAGVKVSYVDGGLGYAIDTDGRYYDISVSMYYSITVDGTVVEYVLYQQDGASVTATTTKAITISGGTHYKQTVNGGTPTYTANANIAVCTTVTGNTVIETGYVVRPGMGDSTISLPSEIMTPAPGYVKVGSNVDVTVTLAANPAASGNQTVSIAIANAGTATVSAPQVITEAQAKAGITLTFKLSNITAQTGDVTATVTAEVPTRTIADAVVTYTDADTGLTVTAMADKAQAKDGEVVIVTVTVSGVAAKASKLTISGANATTSASWQATTLPAGMTNASGVLNIASGSNYNIPVTVQYSFVVGTGNAVPTVDVNAQ